MAWVLFPKGNLLKAFSRKSRGIIPRSLGVAKPLRCCKCPGQGDTVGDLAVGCTSRLSLASGFSSPASRSPWDRPAAGGLLTMLLEEQESPHDAQKVAPQLPALQWD